MHKSTLNSLELLLVWLGLIEEFLHDKLRSKCIFISVTRAAGRPMDVISVWFFKIFFANDVVSPHCTVSTVDLKMSVKHSFGCVIVSPLLFALFMCPLDVSDAGAWHIQTFESSTRQNHTQENSVYWVVFCFFFPLAASLDTSWHDHLIKELTGVTSVAKAIYTKQSVHTVCSCTHTNTHTQKFMKTCSSHTSTYQYIKNTHKDASA